MSDTELEIEINEKFCFSAIVFSTLNTIHSFANNLQLFAEDKENIGEYSPMFTLSFYVPLDTRGNR